jgi:hypothetical protein
MDIVQEEKEKVPDPKTVRIFQEVEAKIWMVQAVKEMHTLTCSMKFMV